MTPHLSDSEIADICAPLVLPAAQRRFLEKLGMVVKAKPNGRPLLARGEFERVLVGGQPGQRRTEARQGPNRDALLQVLTKGRANG